MQTITAKRVLMVVIAVFSISLMIGCAHMDKAPKDRPGYLYYHKPLPEAARALDEARMAGKDKECPAEFNDAKDMVDKAYETYMACRTQEAIDMAQEAIGKIKALCPAKPVAEMKPEPKAAEPVVILVPEPKAEEKVMAKAETKKVTFSADSSADSLFDFDKSTVKPAGKQALDKFAVDLRGANFDVITVTGHTDRIGSHAYNMKLSTRRAEAVKTYLVESAGVPAGKIEARGVDGANPVTQPGECKGKKATKKLIACLGPDRRVEVEVVATRTSK